MRQCINLLVSVFVFVSVFVAYASPLKCQNSSNKWTNTDTNTVTDTITIQSVFVFVSVFVFLSVIVRLASSGICSPRDDTNTDASHSIRHSIATG